MASAAKKTIPKDIFFDGKVNIVWKDGVHMTYNYRDLRSSCPCAECVDEWTGEKILDDSTIEDGIHPLKSAYVGNYGLEICWSDTHDTGIYTFKALRNSYPSITEESN